MRRIDLAGQRFGKLTAIRIAAGKDSRWLCLCDCGSETICHTDSLRGGKTKSCGCIKRSVLGSSRKTHGLSRTPTYIAWQNMRARCESPGYNKRHRYSDRGITICDRWQSFENFLADMGERPSGNLTLERIDNDGNYEPGNCRWATRKDQQNNRTRTVRFEGKSARVWADELGISIQAARMRITKHGTVYLPKDRKNAAG